MSHGGQKSAKKVSRIIWMAPKEYDIFQFLSLYRRLDHFRGLLLKSQENPDFKIVYQYLICVE